MIRILSSARQCFRLGATGGLRNVQRGVQHPLHQRTGMAWLTVGIYRESYNLWESRAPMTPTQVEELRKVDKELKFVVQPSAQRIFTDRAFADAGAVIQEDLSPADIILGVKRPKDPESLLPNKAYLFFSHTVKGQADNMDLLQACLDKNIQLLDYERMLTMSNGGNTKSRPKRLVSFGRFAGMAGMIDSFHALGQRLLFRDGANTPFMACPTATMNNTLDQAKERVIQMGQRIEAEGMDLMEPLVLAITGKGGAVHDGVMEILNLLPHEMVSVADLPQVFSDYISNPGDGLQRKVYLCQIGLSDIFQHRKDNTFDREHFQNHPGEYRSLFAGRIAPYVHGIINAVYWDARFPRLLTKEQMKKIYERGNERLLLLSDITCDPKGSIEFLERTTTIERPFFQYDPLSKMEISAEIGHSGVTVLGRDTLPTEIPRESSAHFGSAVAGVLQELASVKRSQAPGVGGFDTSKLSEGLITSVITTSDGQLTDRYKYLHAVLETTPKQKATNSMVLSIEGHLFDSGLINQIADVIEQSSCGLAFRECVFPPVAAASTSTSKVIIEVSGSNDESLQTVEKKIRLLVEIIEKGEAIINRLDRSPPKPTVAARVEDQPKEQRVLLLGAGRVAKTCVDRLGRSGNVKLMIVSDSEKEGKDVASAAPQAQYVKFDVMEDLNHLSDLVEDSDLVISLLPAPMHPVVASECLAHKKHFLTASYESEDLRALRDQAEHAGIIMLNEVGLDPGLDHMSAMKIIDDIKARGGLVTSFSSCCGGLPAPEAANNPLKYKFSWNPMGVIRASQNSACYRLDGTVKNIPGEKLLQSATPFVGAWPSLDLECLPNRDSLQYEHIYGLEAAETFYRGTLRYRGFSDLMVVFQEMGLLEPHHSEAMTWEQLLDELRLRQHGDTFERIDDFIQACASFDNATAQKARKALEWLGLLGPIPLPKSSTSVVDAFCKVLQDKLEFQKGERDMVIMHHTIEASFEDDVTERHLSSLQVFGDNKASAMSKTVGYTTAVAAELMLDGTLKDERGLLLPTSPVIYKPALERVAEEGIIFHDTTLVSPAPLQKVAH